MTNTELAAQLKRLNRLSRTELTALSDRDRRANPNPVHLRIAIAKLHDPDSTKYPTRAKYWRP